MSSSNDDVIRKRARAAVIGAIVADAAACPLHWIYDRKVLDSYLEKGESCEFHEEWGNPFFHLKTGSLSGYGDQVLTTLRSLAERKEFDLQHYLKTHVEMFGPESEYTPNPPSRDLLPKKGPWLHGSIAKSLPKMQIGEGECGIDEEDSDGYAKIVPLVAMYAGRDEMKEVVEKAVRVTLNNDKSVLTAQAFASFLEHIILHGKYNMDAWVEGLPKGSEDFPNLYEEMREVLAAKEEPHQQVVPQFGKFCGLPGNFQNAIHCLLNSSTYVQGTRLAIRGGGATCTRAIAVGACLAGINGEGGIPGDWIEKTLCGKEVMKLVDQITSGAQA